MAPCLRTHTITIPFVQQTQVRIPQHAHGLAYVPQVKIIAVDHWPAPTEIYDAVIDHPEDSGQVTVTFLIPHTGVVVLQGMPAA